MKTYMEPYNLRRRLHTGVLEDKYGKEEIWTSLEKKVIAPYLAKLYSSVANEIKEKIASSDTRSSTIH